MLNRLKALINLGSSIYADRIQLNRQLPSCFQPSREPLESLQWNLFNSPLFRFLASNVLAHKMLLIFEALIQGLIPPYIKKFGYI